MNHDGPRFYDQPQVFDTYSRHRARHGSANDTLEWPVMRELIASPQDLAFLDLGCGDAALGRTLLSQGAAAYTGIDGSANMVAAAEMMLAGTVGQVQQAGMDAWDYPPAAFDCTTSRLALHYLPDLALVAAKVFAALRPGGRFIFSVEHPVITSHDNPGDDAGAQARWQVDHYFDTGPRVTDWMGAHVVKYHRTIEDHFDALARAGFVVERVRESKPDPAHIANEQTRARWQRIPLFLFMSARKPT